MARRQPFAAACEHLTERTYPAMTYVNIVSWQNHAGLSRHIAILSDVLRRAGFVVTVNAVHRSALDRGIHKVAKLVRSYPFDINVFIEHIHADALELAPVHCLIPNQEWLRSESLPYLSRMRRIVCQTRHAHEIFGKLGCDAVFTSFTSFDRLLPGRTVDYNRFLHIAGQSLQKGTAAVVEVWSRHPEWPPIKIVQSPENERAISAPNIEYIAEHLDDGILREHQNTCGVLVCPSEAEGFGHTIVEAMSCRAVVITTDGSPMNEIVTPERGLLAAYTAAEPQRLGTKFQVDLRSLETNIVALLAMEESSKRRLGENARRWFEENDRFFRRSIRDVVRDLALSVPAARRTERYWPHDRAHAPVVDRQPGARR